MTKQTEDLFNKEQEANEAREADIALAKAAEKKQETKVEPPAKAEVAKVESASPIKSNLKPWQSALIKAEGKMLAITDPEKTRVELGYASMLLQNNDKLRACDPESIMNSVINVVRTGLTLNPTLKLCYLLPRKGKCTLDPSYIGLTKVLKDNGCVKAIDAYLVFDDEEFNEDTTNGIITHKRKHVETETEHNKRKMIGAYTRAILSDGTVKFGKFIPKWELDKAKAMSESANSDYSPWKNWRDQMYEKTAIKRDFKLLISGNPSDAVSSVLEIEEQNNGLQEKFKQNKPQGIADFFTDAEEVA